MSKLSKMQRRLQRQAIERHAAEQPADEAPALQPQPVRKRVRTLLETSAAELEQCELEMLDELLETAREAIAMHKAEIRERMTAMQRGEVLFMRWQISPSVFDRVSAKLIRILQIKVARRRALKEAVLAA
ncbi:MAG: hypothetical protein H6839_15455 [Planctomycetes bacterium]|nr:hypothetical protein [Planctomycetota bacterium]